MYNMLTRTSINLELVEDIEDYNAEIFSTNGTILQPYDMSTTLIGKIFKNGKDITDNKKLVFRWSKWQPSEDNMATDEAWNEEYSFTNKITIDKSDVNNKTIFTFDVYIIANNATNEEHFLASTSISIIDVNDLLINTTKPENPYQGQVWIDDSTEPATIYMWNGFKWLLAGLTNERVNNLLRDTTFRNLNSYWKFVENEDYMEPLYSFDHAGKRFGKMLSQKMTYDVRGIMQEVKNINENSTYTLQLVYYSDVKEINNFSNNITIEALAINEDNETITLFTKVITAEEKIKRVLYLFDTPQHVNKIIIRILGEQGKYFDFNIAEIALYNNNGDYPWQANTADFLDKSTDSVKVLLKDLQSDEENITKTYNGLMDNKLYDSVDFIGNISDWIEDTVSIDDTEKIKWKQVLKYTFDIYIKKLNVLYDLIHLLINNDIVGDIDILDPYYKEYLDKLGKISSLFIYYQQYIGVIYVQDTSPDNPQDGQLWLDTTTNTLCKYSKEFDKWIKLNDYDKIIDQLRKDANFNVKNLLAFTGYPLKYINTQDENYLSGLKYDLVDNVSYEETLYNNDITVAFDWECEGDEPNGTIQAQGNNIMLSEKIDVCKPFGSSVFYYKCKETEGFTNILFKFTGTNNIYIKRARLYLGTKDIGYLPAPEDAEHNFDTIFERTDRGIYMSASEDDKTSFVDINNKKITIASEFLDLKGYTTINDYFKVDNDGKLWAKDANFSGIITSSNITGSNININDKFIVNEDGDLKSTDADISGTITGSTVIGTVIKSDDSDDPKFILDSDGSIKGGSININDNFTVDNKGNLNAVNANISGTITLNELSFVPDAALSDELKNDIKTSLNAANLMDMFSKGLNKWLLSIYDINNDLDKWVNDKNKYAEFTDLHDYNIVSSEEMADNSLYYKDNYIGVFTTYVYVNKSYSQEFDLTIGNLSNYSNSDRITIYLNSDVIGKYNTNEKVKIDFLPGWNKIDIIYVSPNAKTCDGVAFNPKISSLRPIDDDGNAIELVMNAYQTASLNSSMAVNYAEWDKAVKILDAWKIIDEQGDYVLDGSKIFANSIKGTAITNNSISTNHIATEGLSANIITTGIIASNVLSSDNIVSVINGGSTYICGDKIRTGSIIANNKNTTIDLDKGSFILGANNDTSLSWDGSKLVIKADSISISGNNVASENYVNNAVDNIEATKLELTQEKVFNTLTSNGVLKGLFMQDNDLYINATYIKTGTISADLLDVPTIVTKINDGSTTISGDKIKTGSITANNGNTSINLDDGIITLGANKNESFIWDGSSLTIKANSISISGNNVASEDYVNNAINNMDIIIPELTQQYIFNKLTNNGTLQGLFMQDNELYINASYLKSGTISADLLNAATIVSNINNGSTTISGNKIKTGILQGTTGSSYLNLDNGTALFGNENSNYIKWDGTNIIVKANNLTLTESGVDYSVATQDFVEKYVKKINNGTEIFNFETDVTQLQVLKKLCNGTNNGLYVDGTNLYIDASYIRAGSIAAERIAADSITANKLAIGDFNNYFPFNSYNCAAYGWSSKLDTVTSNYESYINSNLTRDNHIIDYIPCESGQKLYIKGRIWHNVKKDGTDVPTGLMLVQYNGNKETITYSKINHVATGERIYNQEFTLDANAKYFSIWIQCDSTAPFTGGIYIRDTFMVMKKTGGVLIEDGSITTDKLSASGISADKITSGTIDASKVTVKNLNASQITVGTIPSDRIDNTILNNISAASNTANTAKNTADAANKTINENKDNWTNAYNRVVEWASDAITKTTTIKGGCIATNTILTNRLAVGDFNNYCDLIKGQNLVSTHGTATWTDNGNNHTYWKSVNEYLPLSQDYINNPFNSDEEVVFEFESYTTSARTLTVGVYFYDSSKKFATSSIATFTSNTGWGKRTVKITLPNTTKVYPYCCILINNAGFTNNDEATRIEVRNVKVLRKLSGSLIVDGTITANHIAANAITTDHISTDGLNANVIKAGTIASDRLDANTICSKVNGGTTTISGNRITTGSITADKLSVTDLSSIKAKIGSFDIADGRIYSDRVGMGMYNKSYAFWAGSNVSGEAPFRVGHTGEIYASNATITGNITATTGNFKNINNTTDYTWNIGDDGNLNMVNLGVEEDITCDTITANKIICANIQDSLDGDVNKWIIDTELNEYLETLPQNLGGYTVNIYLYGNVTENVELRNFYNGVININLSGYTIYGYIKGTYNNSVYNINGGDSSSDTSKTGTIMPAKGAKVGSYYYSLIFSNCPNVNLFNIKVYGDKTNTSATVGIGATNKSRVYMESIQFFNCNWNFRGYSLSNTYCVSSTGKSATHSWCCGTGAFLILNNTTQAGGGNNTYTSGNGQIISTGVTFSGTPNDGENKSPIISETTNKILTCKPLYGDCYRSTVYNNWKRDGIVRQGNWSFGNCNGCFFYGDQFETVKGKEITKVVITLKRNSNTGFAAGVRHTLQGHGYATRPSGMPSYTAANTTATLSWNQTLDITITDSGILNGIKAGTIKGFGLKDVYDDVHYSGVTNGTVKIHYKE